MKVSIFKFLVLAVLLYMPLFGHLDSLSIRVWDESRLAINAYEMHTNGHYIVTHYEGEPDMWNTKPPFMIWCQVFFMKIIGVNEIAVRLPSALAALFTCLVLLVFSIKYLQSFWIGAIAVLVLITSQGYIEIHSTRTGDYDALLAFFTTISCFLFFMFCETKNNKILYTFFITTALAVLTKGIAGLLFLPALGIYCLLSKQVVPLIKNKHFYLGIVSFLVIVLGYYLGREALNPGYIAAVQQNELGGRYLNTLENHYHEPLYYYNNFIASKFSAWYLLLPVGVVLGWISKDEKLKKTTLFCFLTSSCFFLVITASQTKLAWYDVPIFPFFAMLVAVVLYSIFHFLENLEWVNQRMPINILPYLFLVICFFYPYKDILAKTYLPKENAEEMYDLYELNYYLKDALKGKYQLDGQYLMYEGYHAHCDFYVYMLQQKGVNISFKSIKKNDNLTGLTIVTQQEKVKKHLLENYVYEEIGSKNNVKIYKVHTHK